MSAPFKVFVCSTFDDLEREREAVLDAIRRVQQRHNAMEYFGARPRRPIDVSLAEVRKSDLLVVIVGLKYGSLPAGMRISYSQAEYEEGVRLGKPCLVYLRDEDIAILPKYVEQDPDKIKLLKTWKDALNAGHTVAKFESWPKLAVQVAADIGHFLLERQFAAQLAETAAAKGVAEAPLREVLKRLGETEVAEAEIPDRLAKAADELIRLRADLERLRNDRPEFAVIRARASALIDKGDFDTARSALNEGRGRARALREEADRTEAGFLAQEARVDRLQLNYESACAKFAEAAQLDRDNVWLWIELGDLWETRGSLVEATKAFSAARDAAARGGHDRDLAASSDRLGYMQVKRGDLTSALKSYKYVLEIAERLAKSDLGNSKRQRDLSIPYQRIGEVQVAQGDLSGALKSYSDGLAIQDRLAQSDPTNADWQEGLSLSYEQIGDVLVAQGDLAGALTSYRDSLVIRDRLAKSDLRNAGWQRNLAVSNAKVADVEVRQGDPAKAMTRYRESLAIFDRLAKSDPGNAGWQYNLSINNERIGDVQVAQGDLVGCFGLVSRQVRYHRPAGEIRSKQCRLAAQSLGVLREDRQHAGRAKRLRGGDDLVPRQPCDHDDRLRTVRSRQRRLAARSLGAYDKIGNVQVAQGDLAGALKSYRDDLAITDRLARSDPGNAGWQRDLAVSNGNIAIVLGKMGNGAEALEALRRGHAIMVRMTALSPDNVQWKRDLDWFASQIAELSQ